MRDAASLFAADGPLARALPGFEPRPQQARMADEVFAAIGAGRSLLVEAGTGVGKSLAYLAPAIAWACAEGPGGADGRHVIVSTHTRALQEQLARKDLPFLERALRPEGLAFRHALLMGSENYLCAQRLQHARLQQRALPGAPAEDPLGALLRHAETAPSGLRSEIPFSVPPALWARVRRDRDLCLGVRGPFWESCLYRRDLLRSRDAHLLVVNHALFFLDLATGGRILPPHAVAILDEAHRLEETAAAQFGLAVSDRAVQRLLDDLPTSAGVSRSTTERVRESSEIFFDELRRAAGNVGAGTPVRIREPGLSEDRLRGPLEELEGALRQAARAAPETVTAQAVSACAERARDLRERIGLFLEQRMADAVYWIEVPPEGRGGATLRVTPVEIAPILRQRLFDGRRSIVLTSATMTAAGSFAHLRRRLGITAAGEVALGSPYDFRRQALLYLPRAMPDPVSAPTEFAEAIIRECRRLLLASEGGAFVLFTSYALLNSTYQALARDRALRHLRLFSQAPGGGASTILEAFRMTRRGVLLGTLTFWQGVDVPGDALRSVIITRLPFEVPDHPLAEARAEIIRARGGDPFTDDTLPEAILTFRQGFGRLIRSRGDRGLVAALDPRLLTRGYGEAFLESLPGCPRTDSIEEVVRFFGADRTEDRLS